MKPSSVILVQMSKNNIFEICCQIPKDEKAKWDGVIHQHSNNLDKGVCDN